MNHTIASAIAATLVLAGSVQTTHAAPGDPLTVEQQQALEGDYSNISDAELQDIRDRTCYAQTDRPDGQSAAVIDTWVMVDDYVYGSMNYGWTSGFAPCIPTDCPEGYFLVSGNICSTRDPFAHIPMEDELGVPAVTDAEPAPVALVTLNVGDLIEPFTPDGVTDVT